MEEEGAPKQSDQVLRPQEHLPPPTGRDVPPNTTRRVPSDPQPEFVSTKYMPGNKIAPNGMFLCGTRCDPKLNVMHPEDVYHQTNLPPQPLDPAPGSNTVIDRDPWAPPPSSADTLQCATSREVYSGIGKPVGGQTSAEAHHDGNQHRKRNLQGVEQYGTAHDI